MPAKRTYQISAALLCALLSCSIKEAPRAPFTKDNGSFQKAAALYPMERCEKINLVDSLTANEWEYKFSDRPKHGREGGLFRRDTYVSFAKTNQSTLVLTSYEQQVQEGDAPQTKINEEYNCSLCGELIACKDEVATIRFRENKWLDFNDPIAIDERQLYTRSDGVERLFTFTFDPKTQDAGTVTARARSLDKEEITEETWSFSAKRFSGGVHGEITMELPDPKTKMTFTMHDNGNWFFRAGSGQKFIFPDTLFKR
jgi:hypothetical protein